MSHVSLNQFARRQFLKLSAVVFAGGVTRLSAAERPMVTSPRATSGDELIEPNWDERLTITVGTKDADLVGNTERVLQAAVDYVTRFGGGTVQILPGTYKLRNSVFLSSKVRLLGSGEETILIKEPSVKSKLAVDSDWYDQEITLEDGKGFQIGDGICLRSGTNVTKRTLIARSGNRFKLDRALRSNFWQMNDTTVSTLFPLVTGEEITDIAIENLVIDGNRAENENLDGNYAGCIFLQDCSRVQIHDLTARSNNGDGISWQICHDVVVENCKSHDHAGLGLHPGSGSQRPIIRNNRLERNDIGLFFCWGVKYGLAEKNWIADNRGSGISIGHRDTDNLVRDNDVLRSGKVGILFRPERGKGFSGDRNRIEENRVVDSGADDGIGIDVQGFTKETQLVRNEIRESRRAANRTGIRLGSDSGATAMIENRIEGFARDIVDQRNV